ncbi:MAG: hypothetical protein Q8M83_03255 [bacterium]|nr:hypothetical protein [bacterium]
MTPREQKKILLFIGVTVIAVFLITLRLLTWKWERGGNSPFSIPAGPSAELNRFWRQATETFNQQTDILKNNPALENQTPGQNQKILENLKSKIEQEINDKKE